MYRDDHSKMHWASQVEEREGRIFNAGLFFNRCRQDIVIPHSGRLHTHTHTAATREREKANKRISLPRVFFCGRRGKRVLAGCGRGWPLHSLLDAVVEWLRPPLQISNERQLASIARYLLNVYTNEGLHCYYT